MVSWLDKKKAWSRLFIRQEALECPTEINRHNTPHLPVWNVQSETGCKQYILKQMTSVVVILQS